MDHPPHKVPEPTQLSDPESGGEAKPLICNSPGDFDTSQS